MFIEYGIYLAFSLFKLFSFSLYTQTDFAFSFLLLNLSSILVLSAWTLLLKRKNQRIVWLTLLFLHSTLLVSDIWYYRYFGDLLSVSLVADIPQMTSVGGGFMTLVRTYDFLFFTDLLIFGLSLFILRKRSSSLTQRRKRKTAFLLSSIGILLFTAPLAWSYIQKEEWLVGNSVSNMREYYQLGFWGYHGADIVEHGTKLIGIRSRLTDEEQSLLESLQSASVSAEGIEVKMTPNIVMVQLESFQTHLIGHRVNGQELTPHLNQLQEEMFYYPNFYHQTHEGRTSDAEFSALTSLYPIKSGSVYTRYGENEFHALPEQLHLLGYETAAMHAYDKTFWNRDGFYENAGIDHFFSEEDFPPGEVIGMALNDKEFLLSSIEMMESVQEPYFAYMVALTSHTPYEMPEESPQLDLQGIEDPLLRGYYETVHYVDDAIAAFIDEMKQRELWDSALVIFYGDHDSGLAFDGSEMAKELKVETAVDLFELKKRVPLWIKPPQTAAGGIVESLGGQVDLAPTILDLLGVEAHFMLGQSLFDEQPNTVVFRDGSFRYEDLYYKPDLTGAIGDGSCFSISSGEELPANDCEPYIGHAAAQLRLSDLIIEQNALQSLNGQ